MELPPTPEDYEDDVVSREVQMGGWLNMVSAASKK
jgi:hypothetical protein